MKRWVPLLILCFLFSCDSGSSSTSSDKSDWTYVKPSVDSRGRMRKGHVRRKVSTSKNAVKNRNRSRYYYHTRGKYRRKSRKN